VLIERKLFRERFGPQRRHRDAEDGVGASALLVGVPSSAIIAVVERR
jgi:hypothetical protein